MMSTHELKSLSDDELLRSLAELVQRSRRIEAVLVAHIAEVDARRLYIREAPSMFAYCIQVLHLSEHEAYARITVARASRRHPVLLAMLGAGRLHLSGIGKLVPHLTDANCEEVLARAAHRTKSEIEELIAEIAPKSDVPATVRKMPVREGTAATGELGPDRLAYSAMHCRFSPPRRWSTGLSRSGIRISHLGPSFRRPLLRIPRSPHCRRPATKSSSPRVPSSVTSSRACRPSCGTISQLSSRLRSPRSSSGSKRSGSG